MTGTDVVDRQQRWIGRRSGGHWADVGLQDRVDRTAVVEPTAVEVMASTGSPTVTLISCYPYLVDKQRIVVFARLQN